MSWKEVVIDRHDQYTLNEWMEFQLINIILKTAYVYVLWKNMKLRNFSTSLGLIINYLQCPL